MTNRTAHHKAAVIAAYPRTSWGDFTNEYEINISDDLKLHWLLARKTEAAAWAAAYKFTEEEALVRATEAL